jgi:hypothetical protein
MLLESLALSLLLAVPVEPSVAQHTLAHGLPPFHGSSVKPQAIELPELQRTCPFHVATLSLPLFSLMDTKTAKLPAGFLGKHSPPAQVVFLVYSHIGHNGGVLSLYEIAPIKGMDTAKLITQVAGAHIFRDVPHVAPWKIHPMVVNGTVVGPGCSVAYAVDDAVAMFRR